MATVFLKGEGKVGALLGGGLLVLIGLVIVLYLVYQSGNLGAAVATPAGAFALIAGVVIVVLFALKR